jgi:hypothetical protein
MELSCVISGDLNQWKIGDSEEESARNMHNAFKVTPVQRAAKLKEAWSVSDDKVAWTDSVGDRSDQDSQALPKMPCLAIVSLDGKAFTARKLLTARQLLSHKIAETQENSNCLAHERPIKPGTHPFVALEGESHIRCCCTTMVMLV